MAINNSKSLVLAEDRNMPAQAFRSGSNLCDVGSARNDFRQMKRLIDKHMGVPSRGNPRSRKE